MNRALLVGLLLLAPVTAGAADDLYKRPRKAPVSAPAYDWSGVYFGVHFDMAKQPTTVQSSVQRTTDSYDAGSPYGSLSLNSRGLQGGVHFGYNHQFGAVVLGFEGDGSVGTVKGSRTTKVPGLQQIEAKYASADKSYVSLRGRLGLAANNLLVYGAFGGAIRTTEVERTQYAVAGAELAVADYATAPVFTETATKSQTGLTLGGGLEYAWSMGWSLSASYLVTRWEKGKVQTPRALDSVFSYTATSAANGRDHQLNATTQTFRLGLNYKL